MAERTILSVGLLCLDLISVVEEYPKEDSDQRCADQYWQRGGNASNASTVLSILGAKCEFMGTIASTHELQFMKDDFTSYGIATEHCVIHDGCHCPISVCVINKQNGSRTIMHCNRDLPEVSYEDFLRIDLSSGKYKWIHFEGRSTSVGETKKILRHIDKHNRKSSIHDNIITSVEVEKARSELDDLLDMADYVFVGKEAANSHGCNSKEEAVDYFKNKIRNWATVICPWGDTGAAAGSKDGKDYSNVPAHSPGQIVDTLGAGDSFIAAAILYLSRGKSLEEAMVFASRVAGTKCGMHGFRELGDIFTSESIS